MERAEINPKTFLPWLNGTIFSKVSKGGGIITATQIAYWTSILTVAFRRGDTHYPTFLLIDSPRMALNTAETLAAGLYRRLRTLVDARPGKMQLIIADNELPAAYREGLTDVEFSYERPTIATITHPGPANVELITPSNEE